MWWGRESLVERRHLIEDESPGTSFWPQDGYVHLRCKRSLTSSSTYQRRLPSTLDSIQAQEERWGYLSLTLILLTMQPQALEDEGNAVLRLVVDDVGHGSEIVRQVCSRVLGRRAQSGFACDKAAEEVCTAS